MGFPYPGGVYIDKAAKLGNPNAFKLPHPHVDGSPFDFSFSGLKTAVINTVHNAQQKGQVINTNDLAASFQATVCDIISEKLMAALVQSFFTAWIETETDPSDTPFNEVGAGDIAGVPAEVNADGGPMANNISDDDNEYEMGPGTVTHLAPGEKVNFGNPNIPTAGFETFVKTLCKLVGAALELPYDVLIKEFNSSYSASRGALLEAWEAFKMRRKWFVDDFCQPVYEMFLAEAVALGRISAPGFFTDPLVREAWCGARWIGPVQGSLDPKKEAEAALMLIDNAIKTHEQVSREMSGGDWEENVEQLQRENELLTQAGGNKVTVVSASPKEGDGDED